MKRTAIFENVVILLVLLLLAVSVVSASNPPQLVVDCTAGCTSKAFESATNTYKFGADKGAKVILRGTDLAGGAGSFSWTENGASVIGGAEYSFMASENRKLVLTVAREDMTDYKNVEISVVLPSQNFCLPGWSSDQPIVIDEGNGRVEFIAGENTSSKAIYDSFSSCDYDFNWSATGDGSKYISFKDVHARETTIFIAPNAESGKTITIVGTLSLPSGQKSEMRTTIFLVAKPPAPEPVLSYGPVKSFTQFSVDWSGSKAQGSSNNFVYGCALTLLDEQGKVVDKNGATAAFKENKPLIWLTPQDPGIYTLKAVCEDSHGIQGTLAESVYVDISESTSNKPYLIVNSTVYGYSGQDFVIDFSRTNVFNKSISAEYSDVTNVDNDKVPRYPCGYLKCVLNFKYAGTYKIKITAWFVWTSGNNFQTSDKIEVIVLVKVTQGQPQAATPSPTQAISPPLSKSTEPFVIIETQQPVPTRAPTEKLIPRPPPAVTPKPSPGINPLAALTTFAAAGIFLRRRRENKH